MCVGVNRVSERERARERARRERALLLTFAQTCRRAPPCHCGPWPQAIDASCDEFQQYDEGVFDMSCGTDLDHGVLIAGFRLETSR